MAPTVAKPYYRAVMTIQDALLFLIESGPGRTEAELARAIFGPNGYQQQVNGDCRMLENRGAVERRGTGGAVEPFTYYLKATHV